VIDIDLIEVDIAHTDDGPALAHLVLTLRLASTNVVRAAERLVDPGDSVGQVSVLLSGWLDELAQAIETRLLELDAS
jgi:hypothetical protein